MILIRENMQNRQKDEMVRDILSVTNGGSTITQVMFKAYLCHGQAKSYLSELIEQGFLEYDSIERKYRTSPNGLEYLHAAEKISEILSITTRRSVAGQKY
jgi:predicted transcriptional regulator